MGCLRRLTTSELASCLARGRQLHASRPRYDASGRRVQKAVGSSQTQYIHDLNGNVASELDQNLAWKNAYVHMNGALVAQYTIGSPRTAFILSDHFGSSQLL